VRFTPTSKLEFFLWSDWPASLSLGDQGGARRLTLQAQILGHIGLRAVMKYVHPTAEHRKAAMMKYEQTMQEATKQ